MSLSTTISTAYLWGTSINVTRASLGTGSSDVEVYFSGRMKDLRICGGVHVLGVYVLYMDTHQVLLIFLTGTLTSYI